MIHEGARNIGLLENSRPMAPIPADRNCDRTCVHHVYHRHIFGRLHFHLQKLYIDRKHTCNMGTHRKMPLITDDIKRDPKLACDSTGFLCIRKYGSNINHVQTEYTERPVSGLCEPSAAVVLPLHTSTVSPIPNP